MSKVFFFKENDTNDRDCVRYLRLGEGVPLVCGACFCGETKQVAYENITTILTKDEYDSFWAGDNALSPIFDKLRSEENDKLFEQVQQEEIEYLMDEYNLDEQDVDDIFTDYGEPYRDRGIVGYVYDDYYDLGYETAWSCGYVNNNDVTSRYFDFEEFGEDLTNDYDHLELRDGRIVRLNY